VYLFNSFGMLGEWYLWMAMILLTLDKSTILCRDSVKLLLVSVPMKYLRTRKSPIPSLPPII
jgi:hypothetical protein